MVVHHLSDPEGLNPFVTNDASATNIQQLVFEQPLTQDYETLELVPWLVETRPEVSEDHLEYKFKLKEGITFSDGHPVTTEDVLFSYKAIKNPLVIDAAPLRNYYIDVKDVTLVDDREYIVTMSQPYFLAEYFLGSLWVLPKHKLDPENLTDKYDISETLDIEKAENGRRHSGIRRLVQLS